MNEQLISSVIDKVEAQERKIEEFREKTTQVTAYTEVVNQLKTGLEGLRKDVQKISFPEREMWELSGRMETCIELLKHPVEKRIIQHLHIPKITWITVGLFLLLSLVVSGWYNTCDKLDLYKANDTKYRYLKLHVAGSLSKWLSFTDSLYRADAKMRNGVIAKEEQNQRDFETIQKARQMEKEARELREKVQKKRER
jgi:hypothetical protein